MSVIDRVEALIPLMRERAASLDRNAAFPTDDLDELRRAGALSLFLPVSASDPAHIRDLTTVLVLSGSGNLSVGRILEAHLNARHLIERYGSLAQRQVGINAALLGLWVTDPPSGGLRMRRLRGVIELSGRKQFCSGAGHATHAVVTADDENGGTQMLIVPMGRGEQVSLLPAPLVGMRASVTGTVDFSACRINEDATLGQTGDYLREPDFSAGAWRASAVALGGLMALAEMAVVHLRSLGRLDSPLMLARLGHMFMDLETARLWVREAAEAGEDAHRASDARSATVGLGRLAVETACLDAITLVQQSIGLAAFRQGDPIERICRDLQTYLRQPARDEVLTEAAAWFAKV